MDTSKDPSQIDLIYRPLTGTILAVLSGLSFFIMCMALPLVGPAGSRVAHASQNKSAFMSILLLTLLLAAGAAYSKMGCRKILGGGVPYLSLGLCGLCLLTFIIVLFNGFAI